MVLNSRAALLVTGLVLLASPAFAQHAAPCPGLIETVEERTLKISEAQNRMLDIVAKDAAALDHPRAKACEVARSVIAQSDELQKFAEARRSRCASGREQDVLDAAVSLGSAGTARSLAKAFCAD